MKEKETMLAESEKSSPNGRNETRVVLESLSSENNSSNMEEETAVGIVQGKNGSPNARDDAFPNEAEEDEENPTSDEDSVSLSDSSSESLVQVTNDCGTVMVLKAKDNQDVRPYANFIGETFMRDLFPLVENDVEDFGGTTKIGGFDESNYDKYFDSTAAEEERRTGNPLFMAISRAEDKLRTKTNQRTKILYIVSEGAAIATEGGTAISRPDVLTNSTITKKYGVDTKITAVKNILLTNIMVAITEQVSPDPVGLMQPTIAEVTTYETLSAYREQFRKAQEHLKEKEFENYINKEYGCVVPCDMKHVHGTEKINAISFLGKIDALYPPLMVLKQSWQAAHLGMGLEEKGIPYVKKSIKDYKDKSWTDLSNDIMESLLNLPKKKWSQSVSLLDKAKMQRNGLIGKPYYKDSVWNIHLTFDPDNGNNVTATWLSDSKKTVDSPQSFGDECPHEANDFVFQPYIKGYNKHNKSLLVRWNGKNRPTRFFQSDHEEQYPNPSPAAWNNKAKNGLLEDAKDAVHQAWKPENKYGDFELFNSKERTRLTDLFLRITLKKLTEDNWIIRHATFVAPDSTYITNKDKKLGMDAGRSGRERCGAKYGATQIVKRSLFEYYIGRVGRKMKTILEQNGKKA